MLIREYRLKKKPEMVLAGMVRSSLRKLLTRVLAMDLGHTSVLYVWSVDSPIIQPDHASVRACLV